VLRHGIDYIASTTRLRDEPVIVDYEGGFFQNELLSVVFIKSGGYLPPGK
jgi:hypothetical protein